jgi:hypothetical protein
MKQGVPGQDRISNSPVQRLAIEVYLFNETDYITFRHLTKVETPVRGSRVLCG